MPWLWCAVAARRQEEGQVVATAHTCARALWNGRFQTFVSAAIILIAKEPAARIRRSVEARTELAAPSFPPSPPLLARTPSPVLSQQPGFQYYGIEENGDQTRDNVSENLTHHLFLRFLGECPQTSRWKQSSEGEKGGVLEAAIVPSRLAPGSGLMCRLLWRRRR